MLATVKTAFQEKGNGQNDTTYQVNINMMNVGHVAVRRDADSDDKNGGGTNIGVVDNKKSTRQALRTLASQVTALGGQWKDEMKQTEDRLVATLQATQQRLLAALQNMVATTTSQKRRVVAKASQPGVAEGYAWQLPSLKHYGKFSVLPLCSFFVSFFALLSVWFLVEVTIRRRQPRDANRNALSTFENANKKSPLVELVHTKPGLDLLMY